MQCRNRLLRLASPRPAVRIARGVARSRPAPLPSGRRPCLLTVRPPADCGKHSLPCESRPTRRRRDPRSRDHLGGLEMRRGRVLLAVLGAGLAVAVAGCGGGDDVPGGGSNAGFHPPKAPLKIDFSGMFKGTVTAAQEDSITVQGWHFISITGATSAHESKDGESVQVGNPLTFRYGDGPPDHKLVQVGKLHSPPERWVTVLRADLKICGGCGAESWRQEDIRSQISPIRTVWPMLRRRQCLSPYSKSGVYYLGSHHFVGWRAGSRAPWDEARQKKAYLMKGYQHEYVNAWDWGRGIYFGSSIGRPRAGVASPKQLEPQPHAGCRCAAREP